MKNIGKIVQVIGPVVDVSFEQEGASVPNILDALVITKENGQKIILECQQHIGEDTVRAIAMDSTDGLVRGLEVASNRITNSDAIRRSNQRSSVQCSG
jgi:F-type H+-transporting ATPase subunit beta